MSGTGVVYRGERRRVKRLQAAYDLRASLWSSGRTGACMYTRRAQDQGPSPLEVESSKAFEQADKVADPERKEALLQEAQDLAAQSALADAYRYLQKAVGLIAITLPFVLLIGNLLDGGELKGSISSYYYTNMGGWFVGSLFALGVFFLSYNYRALPDYQLDNLLSNAASAMAVGVALFPT
jgi:hypothetical protein